MNPILLKPLAFCLLLFTLISCTDKCDDSIYSSTESNFEYYVVDSIGNDLIEADSIHGYKILYYRQGVINKEYYYEYNWISITGFEFYDSVVVRYNNTDSLSSKFTFNNYQYAYTGGSECCSSVKYISGYDVYCNDSLINNESTPSIRIY